MKSTPIIYLCYILLLGSSQQQSNQKQTGDLNQLSGMFTTLTGKLKDQIRQIDKDWEQEKAVQNISMIQQKQEAISDIKQILQVQQAQCFQRTHDQSEKELQIKKSESNCILIDGRMSVNQIRIKVLEDALQNINFITDVILSKAISKDQVDKKRFLQQQHLSTLHYRIQIMRQIQGETSLLQNHEASELQENELNLLNLPQKEDQNKLVFLINNKKKVTQMLDDINSQVIGSISSNQANAIASMAFFGRFKNQLMNEIKLLQRMLQLEAKIKKSHEDQLIALSSKVNKCQSTLDQILLSQQLIDRDYSNAEDKYKHLRAQSCQQLEILNEIQYNFSNSINV